MNGKERIEFLKKQTFKMPELCTERAQYFKEAYEEYECEPMPIIRARALERLLTRCSTTIYEGEVIVGHMTSKPKGGPLIPDVEWKWYMSEYFRDSGEREAEKVKTLTDEEEKYFVELLSFWKGKAINDKWWAAVPDDYKETRGLVWEQGGGAPIDGQHIAHCIPDYERVLDWGVNGLLDRVDKRMAELDLTDIEQFRQHTYLRAMKISLNATVAFARRYSAEAKRLAEVETDPERKAELEKMAEVCWKVPAEPAGNFHEALQSIWFMFTAIMLEGYGPGTGFGRMDQYMYKYYQKDLADGTFTRDQIKELISFLFIKMNETIMPSPIVSSGKSGGRAGIDLAPVQLSGVTPGSKFNLCEDLTALFLDAEDEVMLQEDMVFFIHSTITERLLVRALQVAKKGKGKIKFVPQETVILQQMNAGKSADEAANAALTACFLRTVPGISHDVGGDFFNVPMILELALNNGVCRDNGRQIGPRTGDAKTFESYEDVWKAFETQLAANLKPSITAMALYMKMSGEMLPNPLLSSLYDGCIEKGTDVIDGGTRYSSISVWCSGIPTAGDSLAALKKVVFEDKKLTMTQVMDAIDHNFEGYEDVQHLLAAAPKYGNDIDFVDNIVNDVLVRVCDECMKYRCHGNRLFTGAAGGITSNISLGWRTGATPDGRRAGEPFSEGGISPYQGKNVSGVTATMRSVCKMNYAKAIGGSVCNIKFDPEDLEDPKKLWKLADLLRLYDSLGGDIIQFNFIDNETLRKAMEDPEKYRDLLVRVATYSAYFVNLSKAVQEEIVSRTAERL
ncbi:MAG: pyruvate formate lyase family protein [Oscillospiraceae bacterium]